MSAHERSRRPEQARGGGTGLRRRGAAAVRRLRSGLAQARRLWRDFTGESAYDRYVERHRREHPDHEPMSPRQWWRAKADFEERNVQARCC
ncbi:YbdD/YjiX family protein [Actinomyces urogenitalis]|uniref:YbdD/YjiX family protein n=1 Tax=Actinomyces urogenitalis TaxID=103621 RepID=UPI002903F7F9|nr:YbdD/YjiX family protein [Actinomyces urogenitalis]MDU0865218.1 YbdD/YjiX family protein [Actinomyces urogenitalis]MDU0875699.1 YbdD/YjiX family protein [Actinomyces urogenitalis]MDU1565399.1 YbdD/YjiX family protein [Actinomyces urogenitalis]MDU1640746.1 YbdD/YjiX family protein [Actinomyces urogenitalis]MDU5426463.1 YbdD/YjiX family protein [Actinomyces urogenitalis]